MVKGDNQDVTNTALSRDLNEAENEIMEKQTSSAYTRPISVSIRYYSAAQR